MMNHFLSKSLIFLGLIFSLCAFIATIGKIYITYPNGYIIILLGIILLGLLLLGVAGICGKYLSQTWFLIVLALFAFTIRLIWVLNVDTQPVSDFSVLYDAAVSIVNGTFDFSSSQYFTTWVYQLGFTFYQAIVIFIFGQNMLVLKILNILFSLGIILCLYFTGKKLFNESTGRLAAIMYAVYIPSILYTSVLTNQHIATLLFYLAFYLFIAKFQTSKIAWLYIGIILTLANIMRPIAPIALIAIFIFLILYLLTKDEVAFKKKLFCASKNFIGIMITFLLVGKLISAAFIAGGLTEYPLENRDPLWKFVLGLNPETAGQYSASDVELIISLPVGEEREALSKQLINERLEDKSQLLELFKDKYIIMWGSEDASISWSMDSVEAENLLGLNRIELMGNLVIVERIFYGLIMLSASIGFVYLLIEKQKDYPYNFYTLIIVGYVLVHFVIEIQTRYRYFIMPAFILFAAFGARKTIEYIQKKRLKM